MQFVTDIHKWFNVQLQYMQGQLYSITTGFETEWDVFTIPKQSQRKII